MRIVERSDDFFDWAGLLDLIRSSFASIEGRIDPQSSPEALTVMRKPA